MTEPDYRNTRLGRAAFGIVAAWPLSTDGDHAMSALAEADAPSSKMKHTPAPWRVTHEDEIIVIVGPRENCRYNGVEPRWEMCRIANYEYWDDPIHEREDKANARLIASSPDLLVSAQAAVLEIEHLYIGISNGSREAGLAFAAKSEAYRALRKAISRATGEA